MSNEHRSVSQPAALNRIAPESSSLTRRFASVLISIWFGGILLVALSAPTAFRSVAPVLAVPPESVARGVKVLGPDVTRQILQYQAGEANRALFELWGWLQLGFALTVVILLVFLSNVGRTALGLSLGMLSLAALMTFVLIPKIAVAGRMMGGSAQGTPVELAERFRLMHLGFTAFELTVVALGSMLLVMLLRGRRGGNGSRRRLEEI